MGNYMDQYEKYYGNMRGKKRGAAYRGPSSSRAREIPYIKNNTKENRGNNIIKKFLYQLIGALLLLLILIAIKMLPIEGSREIYLKSKEILDEQFDVKAAIISIDIPEISNYKEEVLDYIDNIKSKVSGEKTLKEKIRTEFMVPTKGKNIDVSDKNEVLIETEGVKEVYASFNGTITEIKDDEVGKHIIINHDNGIETYYECLSEVGVDVGDKVEKGELIGKTGQVEFEEKKGVLFKIVYMGNEKNPKDMMELSAIQEV